MSSVDTTQKVTGHKISKEYRDRYANFSKNAHFEFGTVRKYSECSFAKTMFICCSKCENISNSDLFRANQQQDCARVDQARCAEEHSQYEGQSLPDWSQPRIKLLEGSIQGQSSYWS